MSSNIRRQSIISSIVIYFGFAIGLLNTYFFTKDGIFTPEQYGLTGIFIAVSLLVATLSQLAMPSYIYKFYPYYSNHLKPKQNDMITWALVVGATGFFIITVLGIVFQDLVVRKYGVNSQLFVQYYYWVYPLSFGLTMYNILEAYAWSLHKSVLTNFLKEVQWRLVTTILIVLFIFKIIPDFDVFIKLYAFTFPSIAITLFIYLLVTGKIHFTFKVSKVSKRFYKIIVRFCSFVYSATIVSTLSLVFDSLVIASVLDDGLKKAAVFTLAQNLSSIIQAPQRGVIAAAIPHLSQAWKDKNIPRIQRIYQRSSINLLVFSLFIFILITINYKHAIHVFGINDAFLAGFSAFIVLGLARVIDLGTGVNAQIIGTSNYWRFELSSGIILLLITLPLTYIFTKRFGIIGPPIAALIANTIYNSIRIIFLWKKFRLQPFSIQSLYTVLLAVVVLSASWFLFNHMEGFFGLIVRSLFAATLYIAGVVALKLTPDLRPVLDSILKRLKLK
ncbi:MAG: lipopolysaccharide biosynthesis protein [Niabella sp.]